MPSNHLILCHPLPLPPSIFPSIRVFSNKSVLCIRWPKYWTFNFSISPSNEYSGLISFRIDWLNLLGVQETLKSLLQHQNPKASIYMLGKVTLYIRHIFCVCPIPNFSRDIHSSYPHCYHANTYFIQYKFSPRSQLIDSVVTVWSKLGLWIPSLRFWTSEWEFWQSLVAQTVKCLPAMRETWVRSLGQEDPLEKEMATHSSTLAWKIPWMKEPGRLQSMGSQRVGHDWATSLTCSLLTKDVKCQLTWELLISQF